MRNILTMNCLAILILAWFAYALMSYPALPHDTETGWSYAPQCCNGNRIDGDCQAIPSSSVKIIGDGYEVTLKPGDHRLVTKAHTFRKLQSETRQSKDQDYHACLWPDEGTLRCLYVPVMGF